MKKTLNIVLQVDPTEHHSEERVIRRYEESSEVKSHTVNVSEFNAEDKALHDSYIAMIESKTTN